MYGIVQQGCTCTDTSSGNGSDVFGSDICTCKPYLVYAIEECIRGVQSGGVGVVVYFRKEGRALGEVTKYVESVCLWVLWLDVFWKVPGLQLAQAWRRFSWQVLQVHRDDCWSEGYAIPSPNAWCSTLAWYQEDWSHGQHEWHVITTTQLFEMILICLSGNTMPL